MSKKTKFFQNCLGVFQGGGCRAAAYVGAYKEAVVRGVSFSEVVGTSAGSIIAALIGAGASAEKLEEIIYRLSFKDLLKSPDALSEISIGLPSKMFLSLSPFNKIKPIITDLGFYSSSGIQCWLEKELQILIPGVAYPVKFKNLKIPTSVITTDLLTQKIKIWSTELTPDDDVAYAVRTSCSIPFYFQPVDNRYVDGGLLSNLPSFHFSDDFYNKILAFSVIADNCDPKINSLEAYLIALANSVVDGAQDIQQSLQKNVHLITIPSGVVKSTDFEAITSDTINKLIKAGESSMSDFIENEVINLKQAKVNTNICYSHAQTYYTITQSVSNNIYEVIISEISTDWVYDLYLTLLSWVQNGAKISVILSNNSDRKTHGPFRVRILESLGIKVTFVDEIPIRCFLINPGSQENSLAIVRRHPSIISDDVDAIVYESPTDNQVINSIAYMLDVYRHNGDVAQLPSIISVCNSVATAALTGVSQYSQNNVNIYITEIDINKIKLLTNYVRGYKYKQISHLFELYTRKGIDLFKPCAIKYHTNKESLVGLPVLEKHGLNYYLMDGNTRITYCYRKKIESVYAIVVEGVTHQLPATGFYLPSEVIVTDKVVSGASRYDNFDKKYYRYIDAAFRDPSSCLL